VTEPNNTKFGINIYNIQAVEVLLYMHIYIYIYS
jgi:hypothetical protein